MRESQSQRLSDRVLASYNAGRGFNTNPGGVEAKTYFNPTLGHQQDGSTGKVLATMSDDLSSIPGIYMLEREKQYPQVVLCPAHMHMVCTCVGTPTHSLQYKKDYSRS